MVKRRRVFLSGGFSLLAFMCIFPVVSFCSEKVEKYIPDADVLEKGMTLWQIISAGGWVMVILALLSVTATALVIYYFTAVKPDKLLPQGFIDEVVTLVERGDLEDAGKKCLGSDNLASSVLMAGLSRRGREKIVLREAMEDEGRRGIEALWQKLAYLGDVAAISPMVGLLGTVLGMIQAFNVIAFQTGAVKPILLASGIAQAMVTTAAGLIIAVPAMIFHAYFRGKVQNISAQLENVSEELFHLLADRSK